MSSTTRTLNCDERRFVPEWTRSNFGVLPIGDDGEDVETQTRQKEALAA